MTAEYVSWSPDGRAVAISAWNEGTVVAILGSGDGWDDEALAVVDVIPIIAGTLRWSPDGTRLMIVDDASIIYGEADVWVYDAAAGDLDVLQYAHEVAAGTPTWSPDGGTIATASWFTDTLTCDGDSVEVRHLDIVTEPVDGGAPTRQTSSFVAGSPAWPSCGPTYPTNEFSPLWR